MFHSLRFVVVLAFLWVGNNCGAAIIFTQQGRDLLVEVQNPITFTVSRDTSDDRFGFAFYDLVDKGIGSAGINLTFEEESVPGLIGSGLFARTPWVGVHRGVSFLELVYLTNETSLDVGDTVTLTPGRFTLDGLFAISWFRGLNYWNARHVYLTAGSGRIISAPTSTAVPESSITCLIFFALGAVLARRPSFRW